MKKDDMLNSVKSFLLHFGKIDEKVINAIEKIDRQDFMGINKELAYEDKAIQIGHGQTISQPSTVARMLSVLELKKSDEVLEIGAGSGWNAALLGYLAKSVLTTEIVKELAERAQKILRKLKIINVRVIREDFRSQKKQFDRIIFTAGIFHDKKQEEIIKNFAKSNLKSDGILICPHQHGPLIIYRKINSRLIKKFTDEEYIFVPLIL